MKKLKDDLAKLVRETGYSAYDIIDAYYAFKDQKDGALTWGEFVDKLKNGELVEFMD